MKRSRFQVLIAVSLLLSATAALAATRIDMEDPRRATGREDDVRVDAQLLQDSLSPGNIIGVAYQIENLTSAPVGIADKVCDVSYDGDTQTITLGVGSEVPKDGVMPRLVVIAPGETKAFTVGGVLRVATPSVRSPLTAVPRLIQIKVTFLREVAAFADLIRKQTASAAPLKLSDAQFEKWMESNDTIFLNTLPVRWDTKPRTNSVDVEQSGAAGH